MAERVETLQRFETLLARQLDGSISEPEARELEILLRNDDETRRAYVLQCQMHAMLSAEQDVVRSLVDTDPRNNVVSLPTAARVVPDVAADETGDIAPAIVRRRFPLLRTRSHWMVAAAMAASVVVAFSVGRFLSMPSPTGDRAPHAGRAVELVRETELSDGSTVELATQSTLSIRYTDRERSLELQGGQAHFSVVADPKRPFVVTAGEVRVRAVGTAFDVRRAGERVVVTVTEGKVEIDRAVGAPAERARVEARSVQAMVVPAGGQVAWERDEPAPVLAAVNPARALAWREGRLEYLNEPLDAVVHDLNRYSGHPVVLRGEALARLRVTGTVFTDSTAEWLATLPGTFPVRVELQNGTYVIVPRDPSEHAG